MIRPDRLLLRLQEGGCPCGPPGCARGRRPFGAWRPRSSPPSTDVQIKETGRGWWCSERATIRSQTAHWLERNFYTNFRRLLQFRQHKLSTVHNHVLYNVFLASKTDISHLLLNVFRGIRRLLRRLDPPGSDQLLLPRLLLGYLPSCVCFSLPLLSKNYFNIFTFHFFSSPRLPSSCSEQTRRSCKRHRPERRAVYSWSCTPQARRRESLSSAVISMFHTCQRPARNRGTRQGCCVTRLKCALS